MEYDGWLKIGMALHNAYEGSEEGLSLFDDWSAKSDKYEAREPERKWRSFNKGGITIRTLFKMARDDGWTGKTPDKLWALNESYSMVIVGGKARVMHCNSSNEYDMLSVDAFKTLYANQFIHVGTDKKTQIKELGKAWVMWADRCTYKEGICFEPSGADDPLKLNLWTGFPYKPMAHDERIEVIREYILNIVCNGNEKHYDYLIKWMAGGFQHPEKIAEVAVVLRGGKGSGKGTLGKLLKKMWGIHGKHISSSQHLSGNFNGHLKNCCFMFADEAYFAADKAGEANLKALITEPTMMIEFKGVDATESKNCLKILMASNSDWVVPSSKDERRFFCLDVDERFKDEGEKSKYFIELYKAIEDETTMAMFMDYMLTLGLKDFNVRKYPETEANKAQRMESLGVIPRFLLEACARGYLAGELNGWHNRVQTKVIEEGLYTWGKTNFKNVYERPTANNVQNYLCKSLKLMSKAHRGTAYMKHGCIYVSSEPKVGYDLGTADELKSRIINFEKLPEDVLDGF